MQLQQKKRRIFAKTLLVLLAFFAVLSSLAPYISPLTFWPVAILGLGFYYLYIIVALLLVSLLLLRRKSFFIILIPFLTGLPVIIKFIAFHFKERTFADNSHAFKVMTYNVRIFDLYNWSRNLKSRIEFFDFFNKEKPDVLCLQEFYTSCNKEHQNLESIRETDTLKNVHALLPIFLYGTDHFGIATFTHYPIIKKETIFSDSSSANGAICTDILIKNDTVRVYNLHLQSIRFRKEDYGFVKNISTPDSNNYLRNVAGIITRLKKAFKKRTLQAQIVARHIELCPYPYLVCGDFNDTPSSYAYHLISKNTQDAFLTNGSGAGKTYNGIFPAFRIDFILTSPDLRTTSYLNHTFSLSDHYPVSANVEIVK